MPLALIVEDDLNIRLLFREALSSAGFEAILAGSAREAIAVLDNHNDVPQIAFIDLNMPGLPGTDVLEHIKTTPRLAAMKTVVVTGNDRADARVEELGADLMLLKPVSIEEMITLAHRLTDKRKDE